MALVNPKVITMTNRAFSCTRYNDLYGCLTYVGALLPNVVYTNYHVLLLPIQKLYDSKNAHGSTTSQREQYHTNDIVVHTLYGYVQLRDVHYLMGITDFAHKL